MHVFMDLVLNHASDEHPWFQQALSEAALTGPFRQCFHFSTAPPPSLASLETAAWYQHKNDTQTFWYRATFGPKMPDWNLASRRVYQHHLQVAYFWLVKIGVDGFRMDAVKAILFSLDRKPCLGSWWWLQGFYARCRRLKPSVRILGELTMSSAVIATAQVRSIMDLGFEFSLTEAIYASILTKSVFPLTRVLDLLGHLYLTRGASYVTFIQP
jgi:glycosidase